MSHAEDDLEALFDEISAQRQNGAAPAVAAPERAPEAAPAAQAESHTDPDKTPEQTEAERQIYERVGSILRMLHDSMRELGFDRTLSDVATQITDAQHRLEHIASLTEQAANKVLNAVDTSLPEQDALSRQAQDMDQRWEQLFEGKLSVEEFKALAGDSKQFANAVLKASDAEKARLLDIMMAQDFQDITGQLIKKIVHITATAERELAQLLRDNAPADLRATMAEQRTPQELMSGPSSPSNAMAQDDVDSLLDDLGF